jgi:hypothetical protein
MPGYVVQVKVYVAQVEVYADKPQFCGLLYGNMKLDRGSVLR